MYIFSEGKLHPNSRAVQASPVQLLLPFALTHNTMVLPPVVGCDWFVEGVELVPFIIAIMIMAILINVRAITLFQWFFMASVSSRWLEATAC
jgi:hypothetical protein